MREQDSDYITMIKGSGRQMNIDKILVAFISVAVLVMLVAFVCNIIEWIR